MTFELCKAYRLARYSEAAYLDEPAIDVRALRADFIKPVSFDAFGPDGPLGISALVGGSRGHLVLAFRGTVFDVRSWPKLLLTAANWIVNLAAFQVPHARHGWRVHGGFAHAVGATWAQIHDTVRSHLRPGQRLWITGHSLGGALANLAAQEFCLSGIDVAGTYTFGAPRVGDPAFAQACRSPHYRLENRHDLVPHLPPPPSLAGLGNVVLGGLADALEELLGKGILLVSYADRGIATQLADFVGGFLRVLRNTGTAEYKHAGSLKYFDPDGDLVHFDARPEVPEELLDVVDEDALRAIGRAGCDFFRLVTFLQQLLEDLRGASWTFLSDHRIQSYVDRLGVYAKGA
jgi:hypothetical protein